MLLYSFINGLVISSLHFIANFAETSTMLDDVFSLRISIVLIISVSEVDVQKLVYITFGCKRSRVGIAWS